MGIYIGIGVIAFIIALLAVIATRPESFRIDRSAQINASVDAVFSLINDFHNWSQWSPWEKIDPNMRKTFDGPSAGPGAIYSWVGNKKVGEGRMTLQDSKPGEFVSIKLEFIKPFKATNQTIFKITPSDGVTKVNWSMNGKNNFMGKAFTLFMDMDKIVGKDFEKGLAQMKSVAEAAPKS